MQGRLLKTYPEFLDEKTVSVSYTFCTHLAKVKYNMVSELLKCKYVISQLEVNITRKLYHKL